MHIYIFKFICEYTCIHDAKHVYVYMYTDSVDLFTHEIRIERLVPYVCNTHINQVYLSTHTPEISFLPILCAYTVAKMHKMPYLDKSLSAKEPYNQWLFLRKRPAT